MCYMLILHLYKCPPTNPAPTATALLSSHSFIRFITIISRKTCVQCHPSKMTIWIGQHDWIIIRIRIPIHCNRVILIARIDPPIRTHHALDYNNAQLDNTCQSLYHTCIPHIQTDYLCDTFCVTFNTLPHASYSYVTTTSLS